jgi:hypothetical protein
MENQTLSDELAAITVALLLILTALGNATVMLIGAVIGLPVWIFIFRKNITRGETWIASIGFAMAIGISLVFLVS